MADYEKGANGNLVQFGTGDLAFTDTGFNINDGKISKSTLWSSEQIERRIRDALLNSPGRHAGGSSIRMERLTSPIDIPKINIFEKVQGLYSDKNPNAKHHIRRYIMNILHPIYAIDRVLGRDCICKKCVNTNLYKINKNKRKKERPNNQCGTCK